MSMGIITQPQSHQIAEGRIGGKSSIYKFGRGTVTTTDSIIWDGGGDMVDYKGFVTAATTVDVYSSSVNDDGPSGTHAHDVRIFGLNENWEEISEDITLNGTSKVTSSNTYLRVFRAFILSGNNIFVPNDGDITIEKTGDTTTVFAKVLSGLGQTHMAIYTIPANHIGLVLNADANTGQGKSVVAKLRARDNTVSDSVFLVKASRDIFENSFVRNYSIPRKFSEKTDLMMTAAASVGSVEVSSSFEILLIKNGA